MNVAMMHRLLFLTFASLSLPAAAFADGKATYDKMCASCHGADGKGNADKAKLLKLDVATLNLGRAESAKLTQDDLKKIITDGKAKMPAYGKKLKPEEVDPIVAHTTTLATAIRGEK